MNLSAPVSQVALISGIAVSGSKLAKEITEFIRDAESILLFKLRESPNIYMHPVVALVTAGVEMDVPGIDYANYTDSDCNLVVQTFPRTAHFKEDILQAFYEGIQRKPETSSGSVKAEVLANQNPNLHRGNFCSRIRNSSWRG
jgi:hypothetical protein